MELPDQFELLLPVLETKCAEMRAFDSAKLSPEDLWGYCINGLWRNQDIPALPLHEKVRRIFAIRMWDYVEYSQAEEFKADKWFSGPDSDDWRELLKPAPATRKRFDTR